MAVQKIRDLGVEQAFDFLEPKRGWKFIFVWYSVGIFDCESSQQFHKMALVWEKEVRWNMENLFEFISALEVAIGANQNLGVRAIVSKGGQDLTCLLHIT